MLGSRRNGLNHVSMNLGDFNRASGPVRGTDYPIYSDALLDWYKTKNVKSVRLMFTWEAVQSALGGPVPASGPSYVNYWTDLTSVLTRLLARDIYVILSPWQYNPASGDTDIVYRGAPITSGVKVGDDFADFWGKFATATNGVTGNDQRVAFDLINEPHTHDESGNKPGDIGISLADWFTCAQTAIDAIRAAGATNTIFVPGMAYTDADSFTTNGSSTEWLKLTDPHPQKNIAVTVHCYTGLGSASKTVLRDACSALVAWARANNGTKVNIGEIAINAGNNGRGLKADGTPNYCSTFAIAQLQWADWKSFCVANNDILVGWNWWANSALGWWNQGDSCDPDGFHWGLTLDNAATQTIYMDLIEDTLPVMSQQLTKPLVVPEYLNALVKLYVADARTGATIQQEPYTINLQNVLTSLIPGKIAAPNSCALNGNDLFISNSSTDSQCIFKVPNYIDLPAQAAARTFIFTLEGSDYVGMAFDPAGNLYATEGNFGDNRIVKYTGAATPFPGAAFAAVNNFATRMEIGSAGATSYFANLAFDATGNLWVSDYKNHRIVVFDAANLGGINTFHVLDNLNGDIPVANTNAALNANTSHLFAEPEGLDFDGAGNLWVANNNDGNGLGGVQTLRTSLVKLTPAIQQALLDTAAGEHLTPALQQSNEDLFIYQVPNLSDDLGARPQFGGLQVDRAAGRIFVNEQQAKKGRWYDVATIAAVGTSTNANDLDIVSTNPGNGGIALINAQLPIP